MVRSILSFVAFSALCILPQSVFSAPAPEYAGGLPTWGGSWSDSYQYCSPDNVQVRHDFDSLSIYDRKAYTDAIKCMMSLPSRLDPVKYPGAKNRYLDYATVHINRTLEVHLDGFFFTWHRMFVHLFEQDLKYTCGFNGTQPYWNWPATAANLTGSAIFDGSAYSMSGDGDFNDTGPVVLGPTLSLPHGGGGGCVNNGPFAGINYTMNTIPVTVITAGGPLPNTSFDYNPKCLTRDLNSFVAQTWANSTDYDQAIAAPDIDTFSVLMNGSPQTGNLGLHSGAHFTMGEPASNLFSSVQDPIWFPLHTFLDKMYVTWQQQHPDKFWTLSGTQSALNIPPSANVTLGTYEPDWSIFYPTVQVADLMNITSGPFCYRYG